MAAPLPRYRRLPGRSAGLALYTSLYLGPDHLLQVASTGYSETYKRFYFRDIQAISVAQSRTGTLTNVVLGGLTFLSLLATLFLSLPGGAAGGAVFFGILGGFLSVALLTNVIAGPTCRCHIRTPVQIERLPSLGRVRRALRVVRQIRPLIESAQGSIVRQTGADVGTVSPAETGGEVPPVLADQSPAPPPAPGEGGSAPAGS